MENGERRNQRNDFTTSFVARQPKTLRRAWPRMLLAAFAALFLHFAVAADNDLSLALPRGTLLNTLTDTQANLIMAQAGYTRPPFIGTVYEIRTTEPLQLVRTYLYDASDPFNASGRWTMRALNLRGLTPDQVKDVYALPTAVDRVTIVQIPASTRIFVGIAGPLSGWGNGSGPQIYLFDRPDLANYQPQTLLTASTFYYAPSSGSGNAFQVANYLDHRLPAPFSDMETAYDTLDTLNFTNAISLQSALNQLTGESHSALSAAATYAAQGVSRALLERLQAPGGAAAAQRIALASAAGSALGAPGASTAVQGDQAWAQLVGDWGRVGDDGTASGYGYRTRGILLGRDFSARSLDWGIAGGYTQTNVGFNRYADNGTVGSVQLALYGASSLQERLGLRGVVGFEYNRFDAERHLPFLGRNATAGYNGYIIHGALEAGWQNAGATEAIEPFASVSGLYARRDGFTEQGAGDVDIIAARATQRSLRVGAGVRLNGGAGASGLMPRFSVAWTHELMDRMPTGDMQFVGTTGSFPVNGAAIGRDALALSASVGARVRRNMTLHVGAHADVRQNFTQYGAMAGLVVQW